MINKPIFVILILLILAGSAFSYYKYKENKEAELFSSKDMSNYQLPLITVSNETEDDTAKMLRLVIEKPTIKILDNKEAEEKANSYIDRFISDQKDFFYKNVELDTISTSTTQNILNIFSLSSKVMRVTPKVFIIKFDQSSLFVHRSKSDNLIHYIMYDLDNGKPITINDIFYKPESINKISNYLQVELNPLGDQEFENIFSSINMNNHIFLDDIGLGVVINNSDNDSGSLTSSEVKVPINIIEKDIELNLKNMLLSKDEYIRMSEPETSTN